MRNLSNPIALRSGNPITDPMTSVSVVNYSPKGIRFSEIAVGSFFHFLGVLFVKCSKEGVVPFEDASSIGALAGRLHTLHPTVKVSPVDRVDIATYPA